MFLLRLARLLESSETLADANELLILLEPKIVLWVLLLVLALVAAVVVLALLLEWQPRWQIAFLVGVPEVRLTAVLGYL